MMTPEQWQQFKAVFYEARERQGQARAAYLADACADDAALRAEVEAMLAAEAVTEDDFLLQPAIAEVVPALLPVEKSFAGGQRLGQYEIQRKLGEGGMGRVYLARDARLGRAVALKTLRAEYCGNAERVRRFQQEARAASALNHPNILTIYEVARADGQDFIATEFIEGRTLRALLNDGALTLGAVLDITSQVAQALAAAHRAGIIHRDIKPENLMRRDDGFVKVLDFGLAKLAKPHEPAAPTVFDTNTFSYLRTRPGVVLGTMTYMSPEQARGLEVDARSDVFSLGVVLYEMLTGCVPFAGATMSDVIAALLEREPLPLDAHINGLPAAFQSIVTRALQKRREDRYANVSEMLTDLRALKDELEISAKRKRSGKAKPTEAALLEMRVGNSQAPVVRATNERRGRSTATMHVLASWFGRFAPSRKLAVVVAAVFVVAFFGLAGVTGWRWMKGQQTAAPAISSVAVLPFVDNTNDAQLSYLPDGITESLIGSVSRFPALTVMAQSTVFTYKGQTVDPREVGRALKVDAVVTGRVTRQGARLRISAELVNAASGARLWGQDYETAPAEVLTAQAQLTRELREALRPQAAQPSATAHAADPEAYRLFLLGRHFHQQSSHESLLRALDYFNQAAARDPLYAEPHAMIAIIYATFSSQYLPPAEAIPKARQAALQAIALDERLPEGHLALARIRQWGDWDLAGAEQACRRAIELNPNYEFAYTIYSGVLAQQKRFAEAISAAQRALALDPLSLAAALNLSNTYYFARDYDRALATVRQALELKPGNSAASLIHRNIALALQQKQQPEAALAELRQAVALDPGDSPRALLAYFCAVNGRPDEARALLRELEAQARNRYIARVGIARIYVGLGDHDQAFAWLRKAYEERSDHLLVLGVDPLYNPLRADPRFIALLKQIGLPQ